MAFIFDSACLKEKAENTDIFPDYRSLKKSVLQKNGFWRILSKLIVYTDQMPQIICKFSTSL